MISFAKYFFEEYQFIDKSTNLQFFIEFIFIYYLLFCFLGMLYMSLHIRGWSRASHSSLQPSFPFFMHSKMAKNECNLSSLQVQYSQGKRTGMTKPGWVFVFNAVVYM
jgi:hypothetical protein